MAEKSKNLIIGGTGYIGKFIVEANARLEHPTSALIRESTTSNSHKAQLIHNFKALNVTLIYVSELGSWSRCGNPKLEKHLKRLTYILEDEILENIQAQSMPLKLYLSISHSVLVKGAALNFVTYDSLGVDQEIKYITVDEYVNQFF